MNISKAKQALHFKDSFPSLFRFSNSRIKDRKLLRRSGQLMHNASLLESWIDPADGSWKRDTITDVLKF